MPSSRVPWTLRGALLAITLLGTDFLLFGWMPTRYFHHDRPGDWQGLLGRDKRIFFFLPLLVLAIVWAVRSQRARAAGSGATTDGGAEEVGSLGTEVARFPLAGLSIGEKLERDKLNRQVYLLLGVFAFISYLLGVSLLGLKGVSALAATAPVLVVLVWRAKRALEPIEVVVGAEGLALRAPGSERVVPMTRVESAESTKNALGDAVLVVVRHTSGRSDDLLVGLLDGDRDRERTLIERAEAISKCIEKTRAAAPL